MNDMNEILLKDIPYLENIERLYKQFARKTAIALQKEILSNFYSQKGPQPITPFRIRQYAKLYTQALSMGFLYGLWHIEKLTESDDIYLDAKDLKDVRVSFEEAEQFLRSMVAMPRKEYDELDADLKYKAFTIASVSQEDIIRKIQNLYQDQMETGDYRPALQQKLFQILEKTGVSEINPAWLETHYRNNILNAYNSGRWQGAQQSPVTEYLVYNAIMDGHTTILCKRLHKTTKPKNDPFWDTVAPQNHHNCRSILSPLTARQLQDRKISISKLEMSELYEENKQYALEHQFRGNSAKLLGGIPKSMARRADQYKLWGEIHTYMKNSVAQDYWDNEIEGFKHFKGVSETTDVWISSHRLKNGESVRVLSFGKKIDGGYEVIQCRKGHRISEKKYTDKEIQNLGWVRIKKLKPVKPVPVPQPVPEWKEIPNTQLGSNQGGQYIGPDANKYYVKFYNNPQQAHSEYLANELLSKLNINTVKMHLENIEFKGEKKLGLASKWIDNLDPMKNFLNKPLTKSEDDQIIKHYLAAVLTGNWDVVGLDYDNLSRSPLKKWFCIDQGGSFKFRAQGGAKEFKKTANEFNTLLDKGLNPQSSKVFQDVFDRTIKNNPGTYIKWLKKLSKKDIEQAVKASGVADSEAYIELIFERKSDILNRIKAFRASTPKNRIGSRERKILLEAKEAQWQGKSVPLDGDDIEDQNMLVFEEILSGKKKTVLKMKIRPDADRKIMENLGMGSPLGGDSYFDDIAKAVKNINFHKQDLNYNQSTISKALSHRGTLKNLATQTEDTDIKKMSKYYIGWLDKIEDAVKGKKALEVFDRYVKKTTQGQFKVKQTSLKYIEKKNRRKEVVAREDVQLGVSDIFKTPMAEGKQYEVEFENGNKLIYRPWDDKNFYALRGEFELRINGGIDEENIEKALDQMEALGLDTRISSSEDTELMYLKKQAYVLKRDQEGGYKKIITDLETRKASKAEQIKTLRKFWSDEMGENITKRKEYNPDGDYQFGAGNRVQYRFDLKDDEFQKEMKDYFLGHKLTDSTDIVGFFDVALENNGAMISTREKIRLGVPVGGMSPDADMKTGGASYFFTRIRKKDHPLDINFKADLLKRMDAISYKNDTFGDVQGDHVSKNRKSSYKEWKEVSNYRWNETILKNTVTLVDNIETITVKSEDQKQKLVEVFKKHNITTLPDGRLVEDIIIINNWRQNENSY